VTASVPAALWEGEPASCWQSQWGLPAVEMFDVVASTNDHARARAAAGAPAGLLVLAEHQTAGRGRFGRAWQAQPGSSLLLSFLLRPAVVAGSAPGTAPLRVGMAMAHAIQRATGVSAHIKWPNDLVVIGSGKVAGVLCEAISTGDDRLVIIAGIGINVSQRPDDWPPELRSTAISLQQCAGRPLSRPDIMAAVVDAMRPLFEAPLLPLAADELAAFRRHDALRGRLIVVDREEDTVTAQGIAGDGALLVEGQDGTRRITTATLRLVNHPADWSAFGAMS
jgi:BirA family transcriptional regulator, biotin operon repressor / biotin---[acetyl-CoA-carboxylase] ligase